jgi:hypothetical protein
MDEQPQPGNTAGAAVEVRPQAGFRAWLAHAFAVDAYDESSLSPAEKQVLDYIARRIDERGMGTAAIVWMQSNRHLNWMSSQFMVFFQPFFEMVHPLLNGLTRNFGLSLKPEEYKQLAAAFEKRYSVEYFIQRLEHYAALPRPVAEGATGAPTENPPGDEDGG